MAAMKRKMMEVQQEARDCFGGVGIIAGLKYVGTMWETVFTDAYNEREAEYIALLEEAAEIAAANAAYEQGYSW